MTMNAVQYDIVQRYAIRSVGRRTHMVASAVEVMSTDSPARYMLKCLDWVTMETDAGQVWSSLIYDIPDILYFQSLTKLKTMSAAPPRMTTGSISTSVLKVLCIWCPVLATR